MDIILHELHQEIFRRMRPDVSTPVLSFLLSDSLFRNFISNNYKLEYYDGVSIIYKKEGDAWVKIQDSKAETYSER